MPIIELTDHDFDGQSFNCIPCNSRSLAYCYSEATWDANYGYKTVKIFRISVFGKSMHKIGELEVPSCISDLCFDVDNDEICCLARVIQYPPDIEPFLDAGEGCLLALTTFGISNGRVKRFYHVTDINCNWRLMDKIDGELFAYPTQPLNNALIIYAFSYLDSVKGVFGLSPYLSLPFYSTFLSIYEKPHYFVSTTEQITLVSSDWPGKMLYFKRGKCWVMENYCCNLGNDDNFQLQKSLCNGELIMEICLKNENTAFRILVADIKKVWKLVFTGSAPPAFRRICAGSCSFDGKLFCIMKCENSSVSVAIQSWVPCTLLETCISVLWPYCSHLNPQLNDYEICDQFSLSKFVTMDACFGRNV